MHINKQKIFHAFENLNSHLLRDIFEKFGEEEEGAHQKYIQEIERVFQIFKEAGETKLLRYRGYCSADLSQCSYGGYDGYSFYGKKAKKQLNLVFSQEGDRVDDIIPCKHFVTYYKLEVKEVIKINLSHFRDVFYEINPLERKVQKCAEACKELT